MDVAIATCQRLPEPDTDTPRYLSALERAGVTAELLAWDDPSAPFADARLVVIRSTWNYIHHLDRFLTWADGLGARLHNPPAVVRWNAHKRYLVELAAAGLATVPTVLIERGAARSLGGELATRGWADVVIKPAVSAGSYETRRVDAARVSADDEVWFQRILGQRDMLLQPFVRSVDGYGERSVVTLDGALSHAIRKSPRFAGGHEAVSSEALPIADDERALAEAAMTFGARATGAPAPLLYGRVDMARDEAGQPMIMELELIEPSLFFGQHPPAADAWAQAIARRLEDG